MSLQYLFQKLIVFSLAAGLVTTASSSWAADDTAQLKAQVAALQNRVDQLESQLADKQAVVPVPAYQWEDPFAQMALMREQMDRQMQNAFGNSGMMAFSAQTGMKRTDHDYIITMDLPGMDKAKINVEIKDGMLLISGEQRSETKNNTANQIYRQEKSVGTFMQAIPLPDDASKDKINAVYKNGVLTVTVARTKQAAQQGGSQKIQVK